MKDIEYRTNTLDPEIQRKISVLKMKNPDFGEQKPNNNPSSEEDANYQPIKYHVSE